MFSIKSTQDRWPTQSSVNNQHHVNGFDLVQITQYKHVTVAQCITGSHCQRRLVSLLKWAKTEQKYAGVQLERPISQINHFPFVFFSVMIRIHIHELSKWLFNKYIHNIPL